MNNIKIDVYCKCCNKSYSFMTTGKNTLAEMSTQMTGWKKDRKRGFICPACVREGKNGRTENTK